MKTLRADAITLVRDRQYAALLEARLESARGRVWAHLFSVNPRVTEDSSLVVRSALQRLVRVARRGVDVRVLVGGNGRGLQGGPPGNDEAVGILGALGAEARVYEGPGPTGSHAKYVLVDDDFALVGSHHWSPRALGIGGDTSVGVTSPALNFELARRFVDAWRLAAPHMPQWLPLGGRLLTNDRWKHLPAFAAPAKAPEAARTGAAACRLLVDTDYLDAVLDAIDGADERIDVTMFYFSFSKSRRHPTTRLRNALVAARRRGVRVRVTLDTDGGNTRYGSEQINSPTLAFLRKAGIPARFDRAALVSHSKVVVVDASRIFVGSHNWTGNSLTRLHEVSLDIESAELASAVLSRRGAGARRARAGVARA
jgi:phosphatidylserine/phosphatidylglycerophosphate/cardiolipin synthase-like enzyme